MHCPNPYCGAERVRTLDTRRSPSSDVRHHYCDECGLTFESEARISVVHAPSARGPKRLLGLGQYLKQFEAQT